MARDLQRVRLLTEFELAVTAGLPRDTLARNLSALVRAGLYDMVTETLRFEIEGEHVEDIFEGPPDGTPLQPPDPRVEAAARQLRRAHQALGETLGRLTPSAPSYRCSLPTDVPVEEGSLSAELREASPAHHGGDPQGTEPEAVASVTRLDSYRSRRGPDHRILEAARPRQRSQDVEVEARSFAPFGFLKNGSGSIHLVEGVRVHFRTGRRTRVRMRTLCQSQRSRRFQGEAVLVPEAKIDEALDAGRHICARCAERYAVRADNA